MPPTIPTTIRVPGTYGVADDSRANTATSGPKPVYMIAEYKALGSGYAANTPYLVGNASDVAAIAGPGSNLARMALAYFAGAPSGVPVYVIPVAEAAAGTAATGKITVTGAVAKAGTHVIRFAGQDFLVPVAVGDTVTNIADQLDALVAGDSYPLTSANAAGVATLTAKHKGLYGNEIKVQFDPDGDPGTGVVFTLTNPMGGLAAGVGVPDYGAALTAIAALEWDLVVMYGPDSDPYADCDAILNDTTGRWSYNKRFDGHVANPFTGTLSDLVAWSTELEEFPWQTVHGLERGAAGTNALWGTPPTEMAGALAATMMTWRSGDTSRACEDRAIIESTDWHLDPPPKTSRFDYDDQDTLIRYGFATLYYDASGTPRLQTSRTTQTKTSGGAPTNAWEQWRTRVILSDYGTDQRARIRSQYQGGGAQPIDTILPTEMAGTCATVYREYCDSRRMNGDTFASYVASLSVLPVTGTNRVNIIDQPHVTTTASVVTIRNQFLVG